ncbi:MFS transporter [Oricola thermophila]|uniref:MFS transporter n=1 Tax=Oricola thermophila TaxID=2742145 RepID=A0A6N1V9M4_9HYPH|nr:MFS transporter [Oricola thermophila]QKV17664.1 MFS transporter [Oricola thermophila]
MPYARFLRENARWLAGGMLLTLFSSFGQTFYIALSSGGIRTELGLGHGDFGWLYMWATLASAAAIPVAGRLADTMRVDRYATLVIAGLAGSMLLLTRAGSPVALFVAIAGLRLFGQGLMSHVAMTAMGRWFSVNRGKAVSAAALGHQIGESVMPISFVAVAAVVGWRGSWMVNAAFILLLVLPTVYMLMRVPRVPRAAETLLESAGRQWTRGEALRDPLFWMLMSGVLAPPVIGTTVFFHQVYLTELRGWALGQFAGSTPVLSMFAIVATLLAGMVVDRFHSAVLLPVMLVCVAVANLVVAFVPPTWAILVYMAGMGASFGIYSTVFGALWPEMYGTRHLGAIKAAATSIMVLSTALGPGLSGWLIDAGVAFPDIIAAMGLYGAAAAVLMVAAEPLARHRAAARNQEEH